MEAEKYKEDEQSEFNAGVATLQRLHEIKKWLIVATIREDIMALFNHLKSFFKELYPLMSKEKKGKDKNSEKQRQVDTYSEVIVYFGKYQKGESTKVEFIRILDAWELQLRQLEQDHKLNMPMGKDARWSMSSRHR